MAFLCHWMLLSPRALPLSFISSLCPMIVLLGMPVVLEISVHDMP